MSILGIDVGSTVAKFAIIRENFHIDYLYSLRIYGDPIKCVKLAIQSHEQLQNYKKCAITGSSRNLVAQYLNATITKPEILAHIYGVLHFVPSAKTIIEIGGQDSKLILVKKGIISDFKINSVCAAGTGSFIESQANRFGLSVEQMDDLAMSSESPVELHTKCGIFLESAAISLQKNGTKREDIAMTIFSALAQNYVTTLCNNLSIEDDVVFVGGVAKLKSMKKSFEQILSKKIICPDNCNFMGAIGVAFILLDELRNNQDVVVNCNNRFFDIKQCNGCMNRCLLNVVNTENGQMLSGGLCDKKIHLMDS